MAEANNTGMNPGRVIPSILMPLPDRDFEPTESAIPWKVCTLRGWKVTFSTEHGNVAQADPHLLKGPILGPFGASAKAQAAYRQMTQDPAFQHPIPYAGIDPDQVQAVLLPGGHAPGMRQYVESPVLQNKVLQLWQQGKLIGAICHGMLVLTRTIDPQTGRSVLYGHKVTALPQSIDRAGYHLARLLRRGYLFYSCSVAEEVRACLERPEDFSNGPSILVPYVVSAGNLVTSRWPVDADLFSQCFANELQQRMRAENGKTGTSVPAPTNLTAMRVR
jgi:putative intracellular protease/amidase